LSLFVDTSVWSLAFRRDSSPASGPVLELVRRVQSGEPIFTTGLVLQELLQGFAGPKDRSQIVDRFAALPLLIPDRRDHIDAAGLRNHCRRRGVQIGTIDAIMAQLCIRHSLLMLSTENDFQGVARHSELKLRHG
jgi:predicted nucleic acid-binding protein